MNVTLEQRPEGGKGVSHVDMVGKSRQVVEQQTGGPYWSINNSSSNIERYVPGALQVLYIHNLI